MRSNPVSKGQKHLPHNYNEFKIICQVSQGLFLNAEENFDGRNERMVKNGRNREKWYWIGIALLLAAAIFLLAAARKLPGFSEWYSRNVYPVVVGVMGRFFGLFPFSVVEFGLYAGIMLLLFLLWRYRKQLVRLIGRYGFLIAALLFLYAACCGVNYYRRPFSSYFIEEVKETIPAESKEEILKEMCLWLTEKVNEAGMTLGEAESAYKNMREKGVASMRSLAERYPSLAGFYPKPKPVTVSEILSYQQLSGVYSPFTVEANYNADMIPYNIPLTICHELSHLRGFMREDEANFIGYLACVDSEYADYRYSGYLLGWIYAGNSLAKIDYPMYETLYRSLDEGVREDLTANREFWESYDGQAARIQEKVNDTYLKANGQEEGIRTYGRVTELMLLDFIQNRR